MNNAVLAIFILFYLTFPLIEPIAVTVLFVLDLSQASVVVTYKTIILIQGNFQEKQPASCFLSNVFYPDTRAFFRQNDRSEYSYGSLCVKK